ncbi:MAG: GNAT family N-acetyltransferase [Ruminococcaceae bacterium]|nr:GNAT family N-acetyltransferase [Oscillospiraceae bacterium]
MIELANAKDRAAVNRLSRQIHQLHMDWRPDIYRMPEELFPEERFSELIKNKELYVAKLGGTVVGYAMTAIRIHDLPELVKRKVFYIQQFCVDEEFQNHGIGTQMMEELRVLARAFGCTDLQLNVYPQNDAAVSFYQKCGFMIQNINMQRKV